MISKIENTINELEAYISNDCKPVPFSSDKVIVSRDAMEEFIAELRERLPGEIQKYHKLTERKEEIIADAENRAEAMISAAKIQTQQLVDENTIKKEAMFQANKAIEAAQNQAQAIVDRGQEEARMIKESAISYVDDLLKQIQYLLSQFMDNNKTRYESLMGNISKTLDVVSANRSQLYPEQPAQVSKEQQELANNVASVMDEED